VLVIPKGRITVPNEVNGITDAEVADRLKKAAGLANEARRAYRKASELAKEATTDFDEIMSTHDAILKKVLEGGSVDASPDQLFEILKAAGKAAMDARRAAEQLYEFVLHPAPGSPNAQMLVTAAEAAYREGDLYRAYSLAGVAIRGCENAIMTLDTVKAAEEAVDQAMKDIKALSK
jgi:hypothetical protein